ncbi:hypothetical protein TrVE_jg499 [Triparma verrucosa]|uniref:Peptidase S49 domain-containing protein n=1 Tax=Triparma verrucosa TaxID=1606542 RepID=A0A9W7BTX5_9STRA|nr:hypothetical protein TrVE_jg499 [Triparma verrucosa]
MGITAKKTAFGGSKPLNLQNYSSSLERAFKTENAVAVILEISSPGGSPAQSSLLHSKLLHLRKKYPSSPPVLAFCTDVCASGGYYLASACDKILVLPSTLIGSVGVVSPSLGFVDLMRKHGIEDRTMASGKSKVGDNPLAVRNKDAVSKKRAIMDELHKDFIGKVVKARGSKLNHAAAASYQRSVKGESSWNLTSYLLSLITFGVFHSEGGEEDSPLFDGSVYTGGKAVEFGLADEIYEDMEATVKEKFGSEVKVVEVKEKMSMVEMLTNDLGGGFGVGRGLGTEIADGFFEGIKENFESSWGNRP